MNKLRYASALLLSCFVCDGAWAKKKISADEINGTTWNLSGEYGVSYSFSCAVGGRGAGKQKVSVAGMKDLQIGVTFNEDGTFTLSGDTLSAVDSGLLGAWNVKRKKLDLDFDETGSSFIAQQSDVYQAMAQDISHSSGGVDFNAKISPPKYRFFGKFNRTKDTLTLEESITFKAKAHASVAGQSNTCTYQWSIERIYSGHQP